MSLDEIVRSPYTNFLIGLIGTLLGVASFLAASGAKRAANTVVQRFSKLEVLNDLQSCKEAAQNLRDGISSSDAQKSMKFSYALRSVLVRIEESLELEADKMLVRAFLSYINTLQRAIRGNISEIDIGLLNNHIDELQRVEIRVKKEMANG